MNPSFTFLHLSDIHMGHGAPRTHWDQQIVLQAILDDLEAIAPQRVDLVYATGDLAFSGRADQYTSFRDWLETLIAAIQTRRENVFLVPGNHDLSRSVCKTGRNGAYLEALRRGDLHLDDVFDTSDFRDITSARFAAYLELAAGYAPECCIATEWSAQRYVSTDGVLAAKPPGESSALNIIGVNTALLSQGIDAKKLAIGLRPWRTLEIANSRKTALTFLLSHHPLENIAGTQWLRDEELSQGAQMTRLVHVALCGHVHKADLQRVSSADGASLRLVAGAVHDDLPESINGIDIPRTHGYTLSTATKVRGGWQFDVIPRIWSRTRREFQPNHDLTGPAAQFLRLELGDERERRRSAQRGVPRQVAERAMLTTEVTSREEDLNFQPWLKYIPQRVFAPGETGFNEVFQEHIYSHIRQSHYYYYKGDTARVTSVELLAPEVYPPELTDIKLLLLYPSENTIHRRLFSEKRRQISSAEVLSFQDDLFASLIGLIEMSASILAQSRRVEVSFYREDSYYRLEAMRDAAYLTYFIQGGAHGTTFFYGPSGLPGNGMFETLTQAFHSAFTHAQEHADLVIRHGQLSGRLMASSGHVLPCNSLDEATVLLGAPESVAYYQRVWEQRKNELSGEVA